MNELNTIMKVTGLTMECLVIRDKDRLKMSLSMKQINLSYKAALMTLNLKLGFTQA